MEPWWQEVEGSDLAQGDWLRDCVVPIMPADFEPPPNQTLSGVDFSGRLADLIVMTQSCDLEQGKVGFVALCEVYTLAMFEEDNPTFKRRGAWEQVRKGQVAGLHLLASPDDPTDSRGAFAVDFRVIHSLPVAYLHRHAERLGVRWRLRSPYLEHFSQAFARFFMRVGLPSDIPRFE